MICGFEFFFGKVLFGFGEDDIVSCLAFRPSVCKLSFSVLCILCCVPDGCSHEVKLDLFKSRGNFTFLRCSPLSEVDVLDLEALVSPFDGCSHLGEVVVFDLEADLFFTVCFIFHGALLLVKSMFWTSRHSFPLLMGALI